MKLATLVLACAVMCAPAMAQQNHAVASSAAALTVPAFEKPVSISQVMSDPHTTAQPPATNQKVDVQKFAQELSGKFLEPVFDCFVIAMILLVLALYAHGWKIRSEREAALAQANQQKS